MDELLRWLLSGKRLGVLSFEVVRPGAGYDDYIMIRYEECRSGIRYTSIFKVTEDTIHELKHGKRTALTDYPVFLIEHFNKELDKLEFDYLRRIKDAIK